MDVKERFYEAIKTEMAMTLATAGGEGVSMRLVSPVYYEGGKILMLTYPDSRKYAELKENPRCCVGAGGFFAEATAEFLGDTMAAESSALREVYAEKFTDAFEENVQFGGRGAEFILLTPYKLSGWIFENDEPTPDGVPTIPFEIALA